MKLLILTQKIDRQDPILGFFRSWVEALADKCEKISVVCLEKGDFDLPANVKVFSLGKESGRSRIKYVKNFFNLILGLHREYDKVLVHMNQEYVLLGGFIWKIMHKKVFFWRNHPKGNLLTRIAVALSNKVFYTSKFSYTARFKKSEIMPVGINIEKFKDLKMERLKNSILFLGRMSPIKKPGLLLEALAVLNEKNVNFICNFYGDPLVKDLEFYNLIKNKVKDLGLEGIVKFFSGVSSGETPKIYNDYEVFVNLTESGSFDKTILEAAACGCILVVANQSLKNEINDKMVLGSEDKEEIAEKIVFWLNQSEYEKAKARRDLEEYVAGNHSLNFLIESLFKYMKSN